MFGVIAKHPEAIASVANLAPGVLRRIPGYNSLANTMKSHLFDFPPNILDDIFTLKNGVSSLTMYSVKPWGSSF